MKTVIYIDVLVGLNIYLTWFLLLASGHFAGGSPGRLRQGAAALLGGVSAVVILFPELPFWAMSLYKLLTAAVIVAAAGGYRSLRAYLRRLFCFFAANFIFAGFMIALWLIFTPPRLVIRNGTVYYHISAVTLGISTVLAYGAARLLSLFFARRTGGKEIFAAEVTEGGRRVSFLIFTDTGNRLEGPGGLPVVVCGRAALKRLLPPEEVEALLSPEKLARAGGSFPARVRPIPCRTVTGEKLLWGFEPEGFVPEKGEAVRCLLAASGEEKLSEEYDGIAGPFPGGGPSVRKGRERHDEKTAAIHPKAAGRFAERGKKRAALRLHQRAADPPPSSEP